MLLIIVFIIFVAATSGQILGNNPCGHPNTVNNYTWTELADYNWTSLEIYNVPGVTGYQVNHICQRKLFSNINVSLLHIQTFYVVQIRGRTQTAIKNETLFIKQSEQNGQWVDFEVTPGVKGTTKLIALDKDHYFAKIDCLDFTRKNIIEVAITAYVRSGHVLSEEQKDKLYDSVKSTMGVQQIVAYPFSTLC